FMFDFETKIDFLVATQFGTPRYLERIQGRYKAETGIDPSDSIVRLARIGRVKITVDRDRFDVESQNAMNWYATDKRHVLEFQFANDVGVGLVSVSCYFL